MDTSSSRHLLILGCERSGSTWVGNVVAAHPDVEFFMEPFADYANIFPGFPSRNFPIESAEDPLVHLVRTGYAKLPQLKTAYFYKRGSSPYLKVMDRLRFDTRSRLSTLSGLRISQKDEQYNLLNLNAADIPIREQRRQSPDHELIVTKELRLNFKVGLLRQTFPRHKCLIIVRHPGAQIESVRKLMQNGRLGELGRAMVSFPEHLRSCDRFRQYRFLAEDWDRKTEHEKLLAWWLINYDVLIEDCKRHGVDHLIVRHEEISASPLEGFRRIFQFSGIDCPESVEKYIVSSSTAKGHKVTSSVDTRRDSAKHSRETLSKIDADFQKLITRYLHRDEIGAELKTYCS